MKLRRVMSLMVKLRIPSFRIAIKANPVCLELPGLHPAYSTSGYKLAFKIHPNHSFLAIPTARGSSNHTAEFAAAAATPEAHDETIKVAKALALTGFRLIDDDAFFRKVTQFSCCMLG